MRDRATAPSHHTPTANVIYSCACVVLSFLYLRNDFGSFMARGSRERFGFDVGGTYDGVDVVDTVIFSALGAMNDGFDVNGESVLKVFISKLALL